MEKHGIRYEIYMDKLFIKDEDLPRVLRLCHEGRLLISVSRPSCAPYYTNYMKSLRNGSFLYSEP